MLLPTQFDQVNAEGYFRCIVGKEMRLLRAGSLATKRP